MSQAEVAEKAGLSQTAVSQYELNKREPGLKEAVSIAFALGWPVDQILDDEYITDKPEKPPKRKRMSPVAPVRLVPTGSTPMILIGPDISSEGFEHVTPGSELGLKVPHHGSVSAESTAQALEIIKRAETELATARAEIEQLVEAAAKVEAAAQAPGPSLPDVDDSMFDSLLDLLRQHRPDTRAATVLRKMRERLGVTEEALADVLGWPLEDLQKLEQTGQPPERANLVVHKLGLQVDDRGVTWVPPAWATQLDRSTWCPRCEPHRLEVADYRCSEHEAKPAEKKPRSKRPIGSKAPVTLPGLTPPREYLDRATNMLELAKETGELSETLRQTLAEALWRRDTEGQFGGA